MRAGRIIALMMICLFLVGALLRVGYGFIEASYMWMGWSLARDGDLFLPDNNIEQNHLTPEGHSLQIHTTGRSMFALPFLLPGQVAWKGMEWLGEVDLERQLPGGNQLAPGDVRWVIVFMNLSGLAAMLATLVVVYRLCREYYDVSSSVLGMTAIFMGTFFLVAFRFWQGSGTPVAVLFTSFAVWLAARMVQGEDRLLYWWGLGLFIGLAFFVRYQCLVFYVIPLMLWLSGLRRRPLARSLLLGVLIISGFTLASASILLVSKLWWGSWIREPQAVLDSKEYLGEIFQLAIHSPWLLYRTPVATLALFGLLLPGRIPGRLRAALVAAVVLNLSFIAVRTNFLERTFFFGSRNFVVFFPIYCLGAAAICRLGRRLGTRLVLGLSLLLLAALTLTAFPFWGFPGGITPSERFPRPAAVELADAWGKLPLISELPEKLAAFFFPDLPPVDMLLPPLLLTLGFLLAGVWLSRQFRRRGRGITTLSIWIATAFAVMSLLVTVMAYFRSVRRVRDLAAQGYYDERWPCMGCEWRNARDDLQQRAQLYLFAGNYNAAVRLYVDSLALAPLRTVATPGLHEDILKARSLLGLGLAPVDEFIRKYGQESFPLEIVGSKPEGWEGLFDRDPVTMARILLLFDRAPEIVFKLGDSFPQFSDLVLVFRDNSSASRARAWRSVDGIKWEPFIDEEKSYRFDWHGRALWIWGFYERPVHYIKVDFPEAEEPVEIEEVLTVMSPRYVYRKIPGARDLPLSETWKKE